jgi:UDP-N-acetylmuramoyl-L-alanyl-D-glutamate--2,6-diaminopimelate ligase
MKLAELIERSTSLCELVPADAACADASASREVVNITSDSRKVRNGSIFVALIGTHTDGHQYLAQAAASGAVALIVDPSRQEQFSSLSSEVPVYTAADTYKALAALSSIHYGEPGRHLQLIGVTGTNGKTTVTHLIQKMLLDAEGKADRPPVGLIGTLGRKVGSQSGYDSTGHTTPMAVELQEILAEMRREGMRSVVMEVSSHALEQHRVYGCDFHVAVFTNLTQDHLDFHKTMEQYCKAKTRLFSGLTPAQGPRAAVINLDDPAATKFLKVCPSGVRIFTYGIDAPDATVRAEKVQYSITGASFTVVTPEGSAPVSLKLAGKFSVYNALCALSAGLALKVPLAKCIASLEEVEGVRGRFEIVSQEPFVIVDYAHTPDGLENILSAARVVTPPGGRLIAVFGCGGDRDATKRPKMGAIAEKLGDLLVVTSDNPRTEDPQQIITDILSGIKRFDSKRMIVNADREKAIHQAIDLAQPNDLIVVAGKGHEDYQILADRVIHFDDKEVVQAYAALKKPAASSSQEQPTSVT